MKKQQEAEEASEENAALAEGRRYIRQIREANDAIPAQDVSEKLSRLEDITTRIFDCVEQRPEKMPEIRKFMSYYLPTTLKILNAYDRMDAAGISGENIDATKKKVEQMMATISQAFDRQLDALFGDEALDISTDITVMEQMLQREGLSGQKKDGDGGVSLEL